MDSEVKITAITAITAKRSFRTLKSLENAIFRANLIFLLRPFDLNPQVSNFVSKGVCNRFVTSNFCPFGDSCRYLHANNIPGDTGFTNNTQTHAGLPNPHIEGAFLNRDFVSGRPGTGWFDLPPSLKPPPEQGYPQLPSIDWG